MFYITLMIIGRHKIFPTFFNNLVYTAISLHVLFIATRIYAGKMIFQH